MYKVVVFWRWDKGDRRADCFWCVPWPDIPEDEFELQRDAHIAHRILTEGPDVEIPESDFNVLVSMGYPEAAQMLRDLPKARLRMRFNQMEGPEYFMVDSPISREEIEAFDLTRR